MLAEQEPLVPGSEPTLWCGFINCSKLSVWRGEGSDRRLWKGFCSLCLVAEFCVYFDAVRARPVLLLAGTLTLFKLLVETWGQDTPTWVCPGGPVMFLVIYVGIIPGVVYADGLCTHNPDILCPYRDAVGFALFAFGSVYSLWYEVHRFKWKKDSGNKGRLHMVGLARYCIHPNYFGDLFTYTGWAICVGTTCALSVPLMMVWTFVYLVNPNSDAYLAERYSQEWPAYATQTATLIPGVRSSVANQAWAWLAFAAGCYLGGSCAGQCG